ncbi:MAG: molecular chaperone DnaK [Magnetococcus sp. YQC-9]
MSRIIGIDLGTTNSCVAVLENGAARVLVNAEGGRTTPSLVAFGANGERRVGQSAKRQMVVNPENTLSAIKRLMGRRFADPLIQREQYRLPYRLVELVSGDVGIEVQGIRRTPEEVAAIVLQRMKRIAEEQLGEPVHQAVITVPAYFNEAQRQATRDAGRIAGLEVVRMINEPTAAALAYGLDGCEGQTIAVFDLGGGTFDISILEIGSGVFHVKATNGDTFLGGEDFDRCVVDHLAGLCMEEHGFDPRGDREAAQRLKEAAEAARIELSTEMRTEIHLPFLFADEATPRHLRVSLTRSQLEGLVEGLIQRTIVPCVIALKDAGVGIDGIDAVILAGGMTRMPRIRQTVANFFGLEPITGVDPDEIVALGAAIQAGILAGELEEVVLLDVTPLSLGIETKGGLFNVLIPKNETIPCRVARTFSTATDRQRFASVRVAQGERGLFAANHFLGEFTLTGIAPEERGVPRIEVSFDVDADGLVRVSALDKATGQEQSIHVTASGGLSEEEIARMIAEAERHAAADARQQRLIQALRRADNALHRTRQFVLFHGKGLEPALRAPLAAQVQLLKESLTEESDPESIDAQTERLNALLADSPMPRVTPIVDVAVVAQTCAAPPPKIKSTFRNEEIEPLLLPEVAEPATVGIRPHAFPELAASRRGALESLARTEVSDPLDLEFESGNALDWSFPGEEPEWLAEMPAAWAEDLESWFQPGMPGMEELFAHERMIPSPVGRSGTVASVATFR